MKFKKLAAALLTTAIVGTSVTPVFAAEYDASGDPEATLIWSGNCVSSDTHAKAMHLFAEKVEEYSGGSVKCEFISKFCIFKFSPILKFGKILSLSISP